MTAVMAIDPGLDTGWAVFDDAGALVRCGLGDPPPSCGVSVIIERPQVYSRRASPGDPNNLITLAIQVGRYTERVSTQGSKYEHVLPHDWKGSLDSDICCRRVANSLTAAEKNTLFAVLSPLARKPMTDDFLTSGKRHNVIDAVGLGLWALGPRLAGRFTRQPKGNL